ncbi:hypothetical protein FOPE_06558 [Fonsecaea pedrosoi]|nr:hypothetical protein FOPE_06558 [Fonsecaea pedrosoi]
MPWLSQDHYPLPQKDLISLVFDKCAHDPDKPVVPPFPLQHNPTALYARGTSLTPEKNEQKVYHDLEDPSRTISWRQGRSFTKKLVAGFRKAGLNRGDCFSIAAFNDVSGSD